MYRVVIDSPPIQPASEIPSFDQRSIESTNRHRNLRIVFGPVVDIPPSDERSVESEPVVGGPVANGSNSFVFIRRLTPGVPVAQYFNISPAGFAQGSLYARGGAVDGRTNSRGDVINTKRARKSARYRRNLAQRYLDSMQPENEEDKE